MGHGQGTFNFKKHSATKAEAFGGVNPWDGLRLDGFIAAPALEDLHLDRSRGPMYEDPPQSIDWNDWVLESVYNMLKLFASRCQMCGDLQSLRRISREVRGTGCCLERMREIHCFQNWSALRCMGCMNTCNPTRGAILIIC